MKTKQLLTLIFAAFLFIPQQNNAQVNVDVKGKIVNETNERANENTDNAIDAGFDKMEDGVKSIFKKKEGEGDEDEYNEEENDEGVGGSEDIEKTTVKNKSEQQSLTWSKYDFVPGDKIIFEDNQEIEQNGEFPSRWDLSEGGVENAMFGMHNVIYFKEASSCIIPFIKNSEKDYLPDIFTIEFDIWFEPDEYCSYSISLYDNKNQTELEISPIEIYANHANIYQLAEGYYPGTEDDEITKSFWRHIALSFNTRALKVYIDDARVLNIPNLGANPSGLTICCDDMNTVGTEGKNRLMKNIRIAEGGVKLYERLLQNGKIVTNGIKFDVNKATIKPESMGVINAIAQLMKEHPELKFSVEGHTDSDGGDATNQTLSEQRANAVKDKLSDLGINSDRLTSKGWGESKPIDDNATPEGKANNRRVEFIKM